MFPKIFCISFTRFSLRHGWSNFEQVIDLFPVHLVLLHVPVGTSELPSLFRSNYYELCNVVSTHHDAIIPLADHLYGCGLITDATRQTVQHTLSLPPYHRATKLLDPAVKKASGSMELAQEFCGCLQTLRIPVPEKILEGKACRCGNNNRFCFQWMYLYYCQ